MLPKCDQSYLKKLQKTQMHWNLTIENIFYFNLHNYPHQTVSQQKEKNLVSNENILTLLLAKQWTFINCFRASSSRHFSSISCFRRWMERFFIAPCGMWKFIFLWFLYKRHRLTLPSHEERVAHWNNSWICQINSHVSCSAIFQNCELKRETLNRGSGE